VDNFCGTTLLGRSIRVDHVEQYRLPKHLQNKEEDGENDDEGNQKTVPRGNNIEPGHAYQGQNLANSFTIHQGQDLFQAPSSQVEKEEENDNYLHLYPPIPDNDEADHDKRLKKRNKKKRSKDMKHNEEKKRKRDKKTKKESKNYE